MTAGKLAQLLLAGVCLCASWGGAWASAVVIVATERSAAYTDVAKVITLELERSAGGRADIAMYTANEWATAEASAGHPKVIVTLGTEALRQVLSSEPRSPVIAALLPRLGYDRLLRDSLRPATTNLTAVFLDQPFSRRIDLIRLVMPEAKRVGVLFGPESVVSQSSLVQTLASRGLTVVSSVIANPAGLFVGLKAVLDESDILLAVADPQVYSSNTISNILLATYRARIPMIAFASAYVKAGALVAIYATPTQIAQQAAGLARLALQGAVLPPPQYPQEFEIMVNDHVARSLGLTLDARTLTEKILGGGKRQ